MPDFVQGDVWEKHANQWQCVGPPLKPSPEDGLMTIAGLQPVLEQGRCQIAVLGVTPELVQLPWPAPVELSAYDHSEQMIASVWRPHPAVPSTVRCASWQHLPVADATFHAAVGDGSLNALPDLECYDSVLKELCRVLTPEARVAIRCFVRPDVPETLPEVVAAVSAMQVGSFHALKWRIAMSLANVPGAAAPVASIHRAFCECFPSRAELVRLTGWPEALIDTIDVYRGSPTQYSFPTLDEIRETCRPYFDIAAVMHGTYELADRCPTLVLQRAQAGPLPA